MKFARWVFLTAGVYGLIVLVPQYFVEDRIARDYPPPVTHPEYFYGFVGVGVAWQVAFLLIARAPGRYRLMMLPGILEKLSFGVAVVWLFAQGRLAGMALGFAFVDLIWAALFVVAFGVSAPRKQNA